MPTYRFSEHGIGYRVGKFLQHYRPQFPIIVDWVQPQSTVLDVGCGDGVLGEKLIKEKKCHVSGIDLDEIGVKEAKRHGIIAKVWDVNNRLPYRSKSFDYVVCNEVLEFIQTPDLLVAEILRVGKKAIIEFPNFGFWFYRLQMFFGRFPQLSLYGHQWYNTLQIRFFSLSDFLSLPVMKKVNVKRIICINWRNREVSFLAKIAPNFFGRSCILELTKK